MKTSRRKRHNAALTNQKTRANILALRRRWDFLSLIERAERVYRLREAGCSVRGLAAELGKSPTTIERYCKTGALGSNQKAQITRGASAKRILAAAESARRQSELKAQIKAESLTGAISRRTAEIMLLYIESINLLSYDQESFISEIRRSLLSGNYTLKSVPTNLKDPEKIIAICVPITSTWQEWGPLQMEIQTLINIAFSQTPRAEIAATAIRKLRGLWSDRKSHLPRPSVLEQFMPRLQNKCLDIPKRAKPPGAQVLRGKGPFFGNRTP